MTATATDTALAALDVLLQQWLGPAVFRHMLDTNADEPVRKAIRAITEDRDSQPPAGWCALSVHSNKERSTGYEYRIESAVFDDPAQAHNARDYLTKKTEGTVYFVGKLSHLT